MTDSDDIKEITVDLTQPLSGGVIGKQDLFQYKAHVRLKGLLETIKVSGKTDEKPSDEPLEKSKLWGEQFKRKRVNNTIFISGQRGAGKTTFLQAVMSERFEADDGILPLAIIDPTLVETHQHILVDIVAKFHELIASQLSCCGDDKNYRSFNEKLEAMAEGLKLLKNGHEPKDQDAAWFLNKALKHAVSGQSLEAKFHDLVDEAARILNQKLFVIAFDDVDTDTSKAYDVLELIRKYLNQPKLAVLISGDLKLYSYIVKGRKLKEFSTTDNDAAASSLVEHLEQQYLVKVLPIEQRIELKNLRDLIRTSESDHSRFIVKAAVSEKPDLESKELREYTDEMLCSALKLNPSHIESYRDFLLTLPVRSALQILKIWSEGADIQRFKDALAISYVGALFKEGVDVDGLMGVDPHPNVIGLALFTLCERYGELETGFYARPDGNLESYNATQIFISAVISHYLSSGDFSIGRAFALMLAGGAACNVYMNCVSAQLEVDRTERDYINYIGLSRSNNSFNLAAHFSQLLLPDYSGGKRMHISSGIIRIPRRQPSGFKAPFLEYLKAIPGRTIVDLKRASSLSNFDKISRQNADNLMVCLASQTVLLSSHSMQNTTEGRDYVSIYCLLASISEILSSPAECTKNIVHRLMAIPTYSAPSFIKGVRGEKELFENGEEVGGDEVGEFNDKNEEPWSVGDQLIVSWVKLYSGKHSFSSLMVGKVWARIMYSINNITCGTNPVILFDAMQLFIGGAINALLIEEVRYGMFDFRKIALDDDYSDENEIVGGLNKATNIRKSLEAFEKNIGSVISNLKEQKFEYFKEHLPLTSALISCPLVWPFIYDSLMKVKVDGSASSFFSFYEEYKSLIPSGVELGEVADARVFVSQLPIMGCDFKNNISDR